MKRLFLGAAIAMLLLPSVMKATVGQINQTNQTSQTVRGQVLARVLQVIYIVGFIKNCNNNGKICNYSPYFCIFANRFVCFYINRWLGN